MLSIFSSFLEGFLLGIGAAVPLGPINLLIMNEALKSYKKAIFIGFGAMSADVTYLILILYGISNFLQDEMLLNVLSTLGGFFLIYLAILIFKNRAQHVDKKEVSKSSTLLSNYIKGYILTLLNPYTILFWLSVTTYSARSQSIGMTVFGMIFAIMIWVTVMPYFVYTKRSLISDKTSLIISTLSSFILLLFGLSLLWEVFKKF